MDDIWIKGMDDNYININDAQAFAGHAQYVQH